LITPDPAATVTRMRVPRNSMISRIHSGRVPRLPHGVCRSTSPDGRAIEMMKTGTLPGFAAAFGVSGGGWPRQALLAAFSAGLR
jgi:hypothetical protein